MKDTSNSPGFDAKKRALIALGNPLQIEIKGMTSRFKTVLLGMEPDEYLILKMPLSLISKDSPPVLQQGTPLILRYLYEGTVFGFEASVIQVLQSPGKLLFVEYPERIERYDLRSHRRVDCMLPARSEMGVRSDQGTIVDISETGCRYVIKEKDDQNVPALLVGDQMTLKFRLPGIAEEQAVSGIIRNINQDNRQAALGIQFHEVSEDCRGMIADYVTTPLI